ncbi:hypothetical protein JCM11641_005191 [Rhodosporidiobolus odoratus]
MAPTFPPTRRDILPTSVHQPLPTSAPSSTSSDQDDFDRQMSLANNSLRSSSNSRGGDKVGQSHPFRSLTPRRIAAIAAALLFLVFFFGRSSGGGREGYKTPADLAAASEKAPAQAQVQVDKLPPGSPQKQSSAGSRKCTPPTGQKATTYAIMIDAGSTGSRLHLYTFSHCDPDPAALPKLEHEDFLTTKPGLSHYAGKPKAAAESLRGMMQQAYDLVPEKERGCTPIAVKATAGLRLLGQQKSAEILDEIDRWLREEWPFVVGKDGVVVMDGRDEGVYAWITINFLLGLIGPNQPASAGTAAVMDLGGASTQIVFEPIFDPVSRDSLAPGDHVYDLDFAGAPHVLYQHSHLGYGLMQARRAVHNLVAFSYVWQSAPKGQSIDWESLTQSDRIHNPCMHAKQTKVVSLDPPGRTPVEVTMVGTGAGFEACRRVVEVMIAKDAACEKPPCAFAGVYQPKMAEVFAAGKVWALSYFYDRIAPLGLTSPFTLSSLKTLTSDVCAGPSSPRWSRFEGNQEAKVELEDRPEYCLDLTFMYSLLSLGYELEEERMVWMGKKVGDVELGWALGAALALVEGQLSCRADV